MIGTDTKDIAIEFRGPARIVIAENGAGKTTILSALYAFLKGDFEKFRRISFDSIECLFFGSNAPLVLRRSQIPQSNESSQESRIGEWARIAGVEPADIKTIILNTDLKGGFQYHSHPVLEQIYFNSPLSPEDMAEGVAAIKAEIEQSLSDDLKALASEIATKIAPYEILYLPTYRRVELPLSKREANRAIRREPRSQFHRGRMSAMRMRWMNLGIQFGLADVEERLNEIWPDTGDEFVDLTERFRKVTAFGFGLLIHLFWPRAFFICDIAYPICVSPH